MSTIKFALTSYSESETTEGELLGRRDRIEKSPTTCPSSQNDMTELYARIDKIETHLSPIRLLPVDVLRKVFTHFRDTQIVAPSKQCPPLLSISQVCSSWRTITINSPSLWNSITITLTEYSMRRINWGYLLDLWLKRSKDSPLTFEIKDLPDPGGVARDSDNQAFLLALRLLVAHSQRWKDVRLSTSVRVRPNVIAESLNKACNHASFPLLESITFKQPPFMDDMVLNPDGVDFNNLMALLHGSPRLRTVVWHAWQPRRTFDIMQLPLPQLTRIVFKSNVSLKDFYSILSEGRQLRYISFKAITRERTSGSFDQICHPHLEALCFSDPAGILGRLFDLLTLPALTKLHIAKAMGHGVMWPHKSFMS